MNSVNGLSMLEVTNMTPQDTIVKNSITISFNVHF